MFNIWNPFYFVLTKEMLTISSLLSHLPAFIPIPFIDL